MLTSPTMGSPLFVKVRARADSVFNDCPEDVRKQIEDHGGSAVTGWLVWEWADVYLFTEFHMVWKNTTGDLLDISAKIDGERLVLFVPESGIRYENKRIYGNYLPLNDDPLIEAFIKAREAYWRAFDRTYGGDFHGDVENPTPEMEGLDFRMRLAESHLSEKYS